MDYQVRPETKRSQDLMAVLCEKKSQRETMISNLKKLKVEFEGTLHRMEKELSKHDESIEQIRIQIRAELSKLDPAIFVDTEKLEDKTSKDIQMHPSVEKRLVHLK